MRPLRLPLAALALVAAGSLSHTAVQAQQPRVRVLTPGGDRTVTIDRDGGVLRVRTSGWDRDRAALGVTLGRGDDRGVRVVEVAEGSPAAKAGVEEGDRIASIDGTELTIDRADVDDPELQDVGARRLARRLAAIKPGDEVTLVLVRNSIRRTVKVRTVAGRELASARAGEDGAPRTWTFGDSASLGRVEQRMRAWRDSLRAQEERRPALGLALQPSGSVRDTLGLFVGSVTSSGPAERAGIVEGDRIASINGVDVRVPREDVEDAMAARARSSRFTRELRKQKPGDEVRLRVWSEGRYREVTLQAGKASEVFRDEGGLRFLGDGEFLLPSRMPMPPFAPPTPRAPGRLEIRRAPDAVRAPVAPRPPRAPVVRTMRRAVDA